MANNLDKVRLFQDENLKLLFNKTPPTEMLTVFSSNTSQKYDHSIYCALVPSTEAEECLNSFSWDLSPGDSCPIGTTNSGNDNGELVYHRYGFNQGIEPLIIVREFYGIHPSYKEINEEFRLFHRLYHDTKENKYIKIEASGNEEVIAVVEPHQIQIRMKEIQQFLAVKEMHLIIQFDYREYSQQKLEELGLSVECNKDHRDQAKCWTLCFSNACSCNFSGLSRLCGKLLVPPLPKSKSGMWGFAEKSLKQYADFIIGVNDDGDNILHTANPDTLNNLFGANQKAPNFLTAVHFQKSVLDKYYKQSSKFSVEDNLLRCGSLWGLQIDNHHSDKVCAWLGDLGKSLSYEEQLYWRSYNIAPVGLISNVYYKRQILAQFTDSEQQDHIFRSRYHALHDACSKHLMWQLLLPLNKEDLYHLTSIRIPATEEQSDFDEQILALTKILVDSLNEKKLNAFISHEDKLNIKGSIGRFEKIFHVSSIANYEQHIEFLRKLQNLRSSGAAHRKGSGYKKIADYFDIHSSSLITVFEQILEKANEFLQFLIDVVNDDKLTFQEFEK